MTATTMKALVKAAPGPKLTLTDCPIPQPKADEVLIKVSKTGICGTDMHIWHWDDWAAKTIPTPLITGHEFAGRIAQLGSAVTGLSVGQRVSGEGHLIQQRSRAVRAGRFHLDPETRGLGVQRDGAFAEYLTLPAFNVIPLPDNIPDEIGAILDPLGNAVHAALSFDLIGEDVLVTGAGPIGIMAAAVAAHCSARLVVITDVNQRRLDLAQAVCPRVVAVNVAEQDLHQVSRDLGLREGFDVGLEMSGNPRAFDQMVGAMIMGGKIAMLGIPPQPALVDWTQIVFKALTIKGVYGREMFETWYKMLAMLSGGLDIAGVITHRFGASDFEQGFNVMGQGSSGKVVLDWG